MAEIGSSNKITNLWPAPPSRPIEQSATRDKSSQNQQRDKKHKNKEQDGTGKNIDEYA